MLASNKFWDYLLTKCHTVSRRGKLPNSKSDDSNQRSAFDASVGV